MVEAAGAVVAAFGGCCPSCSPAAAVVAAAVGAVAVVAVVSPAAAARSAVADLREAGEMSAAPFLSTADLGLIEAAVQAAEARTTGEIYCVIAEQSSDYGEIPFAWATLASLLAPAILLITGVQVSAPDLLTGWDAANVGRAAEAAVHEALVWTLILQVALFAAVALLVSWSPVRLALTPKSLRRARVRRRAREQFWAKNLHQTRERTGVLIFVSTAEHMAELVADEGIAAKVEPEAWDAAMSALVSGLKRGAPADGFTAAVGLCADLLTQHFPVRPGDNPNEIPDAVAVLPRL